MRRSIRGFGAALATALGLLFSAGAYADDGQAEGIADARETLEEFKEADPGLATHLEQAAGYVVFPSVGKGGFIFAGGRGEGVLFEKGVPKGAVTVRQVTVGAQIGGQTFSELVILRDRSALRDFKRGRTQPQASVSVVAGEQGTSRNLEYRKGVAVLTMAQSGAMAEAAVGGQRFDYHPFKEPVPQM